MDGQGMLAFSVGVQSIQQMLLPTGEGLKHPPVRRQAPEELCGAVLDKKIPSSGGVILLQPDANERERIGKETRYRPKTDLAQ